MSIERLVESPAPPDRCRGERPNLWPTSDREARLCRAFFVICLAANICFSLVGLKNSLHEVHEFRQFQTALTSQWMQRSGWEWAYPTPLFGPPWSVPMEFPLYEYVVSKTSSLGRVPLEITGRIVSWVMFCLSLPACFFLAGYGGFKGGRRWLFPALLLISPVYLYYSRAFMIESMAFCAAMWFLLAYARALRIQSYRLAMLAAALGSVAALVKVTTFAVFLMFATLVTARLFVRAFRFRRKTITRLLGLAALALLPSIIFGTIWVRFSDQVKESNPLSSYLTSTNLKLFNFGSLAERLSVDFWQRISYHTQIAVGPVANLSLAVVLVVFLSVKKRTMALLLLAGFFSGPLVFAHLYFVHDYYFYANGAFLLGAIALSWDELLNLHSFSYTSRWAVIVASALAQLFVYVPGYFQTQLRPLATRPELADVIRDTTETDDVILFFGHDWEAKVPYYSRRRAIMVPDLQVERTEAITAVIDRVEPNHVTALVASGVARKYPAVLQPYLRKLGLSSRPFLLNDDTLLYLSERRVPDALAKLRTAPPRSFQFNELPPDESSTVPRFRTLAARSDPKLFTMMSPAPEEIIHPFGLGLHDLDGRFAFNAHAPTDLIFTLSGHERELRARFGISTGAYSGKNHTDGVEFRVELVTPDDRHQILHSEYLDPSNRPQDRGEKSFQFTLPPGAKGKLWIRTLPGPTGSIACAWAYWSGIQLQ